METSFGITTGPYSKRRAYVVQNSLVDAVLDSSVENQDKITADNVAQKVDDLAAQVEPLNIRDFRDCLRRQTSLGMVLRDRQIGTLAGVRATPTMFINGQPLTGLPNAAELHRRLEDAVGQAAIHVAAEK
jgi:hypothetical protein